MLQKLGEHIASCLARADDAERRGSKAPDSETRTESKRLAKAWRHLARSYQFVESLERFMLDAGTTKSTHQPSPPQCPKCNHNMRLLGIEPDGDASDLFTFECTACGHFEVMGVPMNGAVNGSPEGPVPPLVSTTESKTIRYLVKHPDSFDPETIHILSEALDAAWTIASENPVAYRVGGDPGVARDKVAKIVVDMAKEGERNRGRLVVGALERLKQR